MVKLFTVKEMLALEKEANESGLTYEKMMDNAGRGIADEIENTFKNIENKKVIALVGSGNNGGDALVALSLLRKENWETYAYIVRKRDANDPLLKRLENSDGHSISQENDPNFSKLRAILESSTVLIDGIFGTGIKLPLKGEVIKVLKEINKYQQEHHNRLHIVSVDCPSGVDSDTGEVAKEAVASEITVTMAGIKQGLIKFPAASVCGEIRVASIGPIENLSSFIENKKIILDQDLVKQYLPKRSDDSHKGSYGTTYIIAGSVNFTGAALLAGKAAYRIGTGLVTMAIPVPLHSSLSGQFPEATWVLLPDELGVISADAAMIARKNMQRATALLLGPGFGMEDTTKDFIKRFFLMKGEAQKGKIGFIRGADIHSGDEKINVPVVIDADGLKLISKIENWYSLIPSPAVLTPHPGEMSIMTGISIPEIQQNRIEIAKKYSSQWGHVVILKGAYTIIANPDGDIAIVPVATSALAKGGTGDILSGLIAGLLAQGVKSFQAACAAAWIHGYAGLKAAKQIGNTASVIASDVLNSVPQVISELE